MDIYEARNWFNGWTVTAQQANSNSATVLTDTADGNGSFGNKLTNLAAGTYQISCSVPAGWQPSTPATFDVTLSGDNSKPCAQVRCKVEALACLDVFKKDYAQPIYGLPGWQFTAAQGSSMNNAVTGSEGRAHFSGLTPGNWTINEVPVVGWQLVNIVPGNVNNINLLSPRVPDECQTMTFYNKQVGDSCIKVTKVDTAGNPLNDWNISLTYPAGMVPNPAPQLTGSTGDGAGVTIFRNLPLGSWQVAEASPLAAYYRASTSGAANPTMVTLTTPATPPDGCAEVKFVNEPLGCVDVLKINQLDQPLGGWVINAQQNGATIQQKTTGADGHVKFYLPLGKWTIAEVMQTGWKAVTLPQFDVDVTTPVVIGNIADEGNACKPVRFKNSTDYACLDVWKKDYYDQTIGLPGWQFVLQPAFGGSAIMGVLTNGVGHTNFTNLVPGDYFLSESSMQGWLSVGVSGKDANNNFFPNWPLPYPPMLPIAQGATTPVFHLDATGNCAEINWYNRQNNTPEPVLTPSTDPVPASSPSCRTYYTVQTGDTLSGIGRRYGVPLAALTTANQISNPSLIYPQMVLCIP